MKTTFKSKNFEIINLDIKELYDYVRAAFDINISIKNMLKNENFQTLLNEHTNPKMTVIYNCDYDNVFEDLAWKVYKASQMK